MDFILLMTIFFVGIAFFLRGGQLHNYLVCEAEKIFRDAGFDTHQECPKKLASGELNFVDLLAEGNDFVICVEIETSPRHVLDNAAKARELNLSLMVIVPTRKVQKAVKSKLQTAGINPRKHRIYILLLSQLKQELTNYFPLIPSANSKRENRKLNNRKEF